MKKSIFFIETPLHFLNAIEAISYFDIEDYMIVVRYSYQAINDEQLKYLIQRLCSPDEVKKIEYIKIRGSKKKLYDYMKILFYKVYFHLNAKKYKNIFLGDFSSGFLSILLKSFDKNKIILLDDGAKTISIQDSFDNTNFYNLFTMYELKPKKNQKIYKNDFKKLHLIEKNHLKYDENTVLFIGSKLSEEGIISQKYNIELIHKIAQLYKELQIIYIPHRGECKEKLMEISNIENIEVKEYKLPIEFYGIYEGIIPTKVVSFYSTALWSIKKMYTEVEVIAYKFNYNSSIHKKTIDSIYNYYNNYLDIKSL